MLCVDVPGWRSLRLEHLVLDVNGTLALDGKLLPGVAERILQLSRTMTVHLLSGDTYGSLDSIVQELGLTASRIQPGSPEAEQKAVYVRALNAACVTAVGNGANDVGILREAALAIVVLGHEGMTTEALTVGDLLIGSVSEGLDLLLNPKRLIATLRR